MTRMTRSALALMAVLTLGACGSTTEERVATGALGGAAVGAATGGSLSGTLLGGAAGAGAGYAYDRYENGRKRR